MQHRQDITTGSALPVMTNPCFTETHNWFYIKLSCKVTLGNTKSRL